MSDIHSLGKRIGDFASDQLPTVCAIMLTRDRPEMAARAVRCFRAQTYERKILFVLDTGESECQTFFQAFGVYRDWQPGLRVDKATVGRLRNLANGFATSSMAGADIIIHWDDDDYSHPSRIAEQVALLQSSGAEVVGYNEMLFWDSRPGQFCGAYLYRNGNKQRPLGTSLCYWRSTWEAKPFPDVNVGEDTQWLSGLRVESVGTVRQYLPAPLADFEPRMIATIHGGNTSSTYSEGKMDPYEWRRVPEWDAYCKETLECA